MESTSQLKGRIAELEREREAANLRLTNLEAERRTEAVKAFDDKTGRREGLIKAKQAVEGVSEQIFMLDATLDDLREKLAKRERTEAASQIRSKNGRITALVGERAGAVKGCVAAVQNLAAHLKRIDAIGSEIIAIRRSEGAHLNSACPEFYGGGFRSHFRGIMARALRGFSGIGLSSKPVDPITPAYVEMWLEKDAERASELAIPLPGREAPQAQEPAPEAA